MGELQAIVIIAVAVAMILIPAGLHKVDEGYVGIYWRGGALLSSITDPGFHVKLPLLTSFAQVQVSVQTDKVLDIPCGTSGGVLVTFDSIEVVNRLNREYALDTVRKYSLDYDKIWIFDKIHHEINQFCSSHTLQEVYIDLFDKLDESLAAALQDDCDKWAPGIQIIATRVTKPRIPKSLNRDYELMEAEKTRISITTEHQKVIEKEAETERLRATITATKQAEVSKIMMEKEVMEKLADQRIQAIEDSMYLAKQRALTDAAFYKQQKVADANQLKLSPEYIQYQTYQGLRDQAKIYFGDSLLRMFMGLESTHKDGSGSSPLTSKS